MASNRLGGVPLRRWPGSGRKSGRRARSLRSPGRRAPDQSRRYRRITVGVTAAFLLAIALIVALYRLGSDQSHLHLVGPASHDVTDRVVAGVPVGYPHSASGSISAATNYVVALGSELTLDPVRRPTTLATISAVEVDPAVAARFADLPAVEARTGLLADLRASVPAIARVAPVGVRVLAYSESRASVQVWTVAVVGTARLGQVDMSWSTETLQLGWERAPGGSDWKLLRYDSIAGPVPALNQSISTLSQALAATEGMRGFRYAAAG